MNDLPDMTDADDHSDSNKDLLELLREESARFPQSIADEPALKNAVDRIRKRSEQVDVFPAKLPECGGRSAARRRSRQIVGAAFAVLAMVAAGLAIVVFRWSHPSIEVLVASVVPTAEETRGGLAPEFVSQSAGGRFRLKPALSWELEIRSPRSGFATILLTSSSAMTLWPKPGERPLAIGSAEGTRYGPLPAQVDSTEVLVVVTEWPATETIRQLLSTGVLAGNRSDTTQHIQRALSAEGHRWLAAAGCTVEPSK